ncbi:hypothetical protein MMC28_000284 [Mycoblastus sanguinarius]|nr:hypothetical protein [Mycoblastus sanguinarius]
MLASIVVLCLSAHLISAFPSLLSEAFVKARNAEPAQVDSPCPHLAKRQAPGVTPPFNAAEQYVSNTGQFAFVAPGSGDQRGPCPGLNAMANHGYLPHNGVGTIDEFISGTAAAFGMGPDLASFLAVYGAIFDGDLTSYSIGGPVGSLAGLGGLLGEPQGLSGSHNKYEGDVSPTRGDLYEYGNDYLVQLSQFSALYELGQQNGDSIDLNVLTNYRVTRFQQSISNNPYFFNAPFSGVVASPAAWSFIYRFMANKSSEYPEGLLTGDVLKSFYSITGDYPNFVYTPGHEAIPNNWYKRNPVDYYTLPYVVLDAVTMALEHPQFLSLGGNTGKVNTFTGVDLANLTGGIYTASNILQGNNAVCLGFEASIQEAPDLLSGLYANVAPAISMLTSAVNNATSALSCPKLNEINLAQFGEYPGYTNLSPSGTY